MKKYLRLLMCAAVILLSCVMLAACLRDAAEVSSDAGVGREETIGSAENTDETPDEQPDAPTVDDPADEGEKEDEPTPVESGKLWEYRDGRYEFNFPPRDKSREHDIADIASLFGTKMEDQPEDWYCGKSTYDEATGEVTYVWDRYQSTIDTINKYGAIYRGDTTRKVCYFTFDCGYEFGPTAGILDTLKEKGVSGTFFLTGDYVETEHDLMKRMLDEGHIIGNHTVSHVHCEELTGEEFIDEVEGLEDMFYEQFPDADPMIFFRPPYGNCNEYVLAMTEKMGYHCVMWSYTYMDYDTNNQLPYDEAMAKVKSGLHPGCVYLFHTESVTNAAILGDFIDWVRAQGYEILPICDIIS